MRLAIAIVDSLVVAPGWRSYRCENISLGDRLCVDLDTIRDATILNDETGDALDILVIWALTERARAGYLPLGLLSVVLHLDEGHA
jgi:hypothetical protein